MRTTRNLNWDGCSNVRDLGDLPTHDGRMTRWGAVIRGDHPARLTAGGWAALYDHGVRTIISLRTRGMPGEDFTDTAPRPPDITTLSLEIEDITDLEFRHRWASNELWGTPLYYQDALARWPDRHAAVLAAIANAKPGGVLFHCIRGVDRTGIITLLLLAAVGATPEAILADYELSLDPEREPLLAREGTTTREVILNTLATLDIEPYLRSGGLTQAELNALRARML